MSFAAMSQNRAQDTPEGQGRGKNVSRSSPGERGLTGQTPEDIADAVAFLCSDRARSITGQTSAIDGGMTAGPPIFEG